MSEKKFVVVEEAKELKTDQKEAPRGEPRAVPLNPKQLSMKVRVAGRPRMKGQAKGTIRCRLAAYASAASAANTALNVAAALDVTLAQDWASFATAYDEARCTGVTFHCGFIGSAAPPGSQVVFGAFAFDPENSGAPTNVPDVVANQRHLGPILMYNQNLQWPEPVSTNAMASFRSGKLATSVITVSGGPAALVAGDWFGTAATAADVGWLKIAANAGGAGVVITACYMVVYDMEFRMRT